MPSAPATDAPHRVDMIADLRRLEDDGHVDVADLEPAVVHQRDDATQQIEAVRVLPPRIGVGKMAADVAEAGGAENRVGQRVADDVGVGVAERAALGRDGHTAQHQRPAGDEAMKIVAGTGAAGARRQCAAASSGCGDAASGCVVGASSCRRRW